MTKNTGLGRGLDSLIPTGLAVDDVASASESVKNIYINKIIPNPYQPRKTFDEQALVELSKSIKQHGIIQPLVVTPHNEKYRVVAGERRFRASQMAGLKKVPVIIRNHEELEELEIALVENVQRVDLSPLEQAVSIVKLRDQFSLSPKEIAVKLGKAETTISNIIRLLQLPPQAIEALQKNEITEGHARAVLSLKEDEKKQKELLNKIITQKISVRDAEEYVKQNRTQKTSVDINTSKVKELIDKLDPTIKSRISVKERSSSKGTIRVKYNSLDQLKRIIENLS